MGIWSDIYNSTAAHYAQSGCMIKLTQNVNFGLLLAKQFIYFIFLCCKW